MKARFESEIVTPTKEMSLKHLRRKTSNQMSHSSGRKIGSSISTEVDVTVQFRPQLDTEAVLLRHQLAYPYLVLV